MGLIQQILVDMFAALNANIDPALGRDPHGLGCTSFGAVPALNTLARPAA